MNRCEFCCSCRHGAGQTPEGAEKIQSGSFRQGAGQRNADVCPPQAPIFLSFEPPNGNSARGQRLAGREGGGSVAFGDRATERGGGPLAFGERASDLGGG